MKTRKLVWRLPVLVLLLCLLCAAVSFACFTRSATAEETAQKGYYYNQISPEAKRFYDAIGDMHTSGTLKSGDGKYDLVANNVLTKAQLETVTQSSRVMAAFGAARDAYYLDHPELFYIDFSRLSVNVGTKNGAYVATLGSGRADNYYIEGGFDSTEAVDAAITAFENKLTTLVAAADSAADDAAKVRAINTALLAANEYSFCSTATATGTTYEAGAPYIRNAYGALVNGKSVCEGYATAFKCAMDKLGIDCVIVQGYAITGEGSEPHAWNYVKLDNVWYGVDPTWNDSAVKQDEYLLRGQTVMDAEHLPDGVISASDFKFTYPALDSKDYGVKAIGDLQVEEIYASDDDNAMPTYKLSKNGKNNAQLIEEEGLHMAYRTRYQKDGTGEYLWTEWLGVAESYAGNDKEGYTELPYVVNSNVFYVEFALIDYAPDMQAVVAGIPQGEYYIYNPENLKEFNFAAQSKVYGNKAYGTHKAPPYVKSTTPDAAGSSLDVTKTYDIQIVYTEALTKKESAEPVEMIVKTVHADAVKYAEVTDIVWQEDKADTVTFKFTPSGMFNHRDEIYSFIPKNLIGAESQKEAMPVSYYVKNENIACNKVYGDGRLYVKSYGRPALVGQGDLSMTGWQDEDGNYVSENQRSQLMLVATKPSEKQSTDMVNDAAEKAGVEQSDVLSSQTFEIRMDLCRHIVKIPDGSTVQMAFGFPEGYGPEDEGVVFKVYHFRRGEDGKIDYSKTEEIECIVTQYGLVVNVQDFSPFAVVALKSDAVQNAKKSVFARAMTYGGEITAEGSTARLVAEGESVTYTLTPDDGYKVERITLNGKDLTVANTVTLSYADLQNVNELEVRFVANSVAQYEQEQGITVVYPSVRLESPAAPTAPGKNGLAWYWILLIVLAVLVVAAGVTVAVLFLLKKKRTA